MSGFVTVFISYRRTDSLDISGRLYDRLVRDFGVEHVFMDISSIGAGSDYRNAIQEAVRHSSVILVVIGKSWDLTRLNSPDDLVRNEIEAALRYNLRIVPVLVAGAEMPAPGSLPVSIRALCDRNAIRLYSENFQGSADRLVSQLGALTWQHSPSTAALRQPAAQPARPPVAPPRSAAGSRPAGGETGRAAEAPRPPTPSRSGPVLQTPAARPHRRPLTLTLVMLVLGLLGFLGFVSPGFWRVVVLDPTTVQTGVQEVLSKNYGLTGVEHVVCPDGMEVTTGAAYWCRATLNGEQVEVRIQLTNALGDYEVGHPTPS